MEKDYYINDFGYFKTKIPSDFNFNEYKSDIKIKNCKINLFECITQGGCEEISYYGEQLYSNPAYYEEKKTLIYGNVKTEIIYFEFLTKSDHDSKEDKIKSISSGLAQHYCSDNIHITVDWHYIPPENTVSNSYARRSVSSPVGEMRDFQKTALENIELLHEKMLSYIRDEKTLSGIAKNDKHYWIRRDAAEMINDESVLKNIALNDENSEVRRAAVGKISDGSALKKIAENDEDPSISSAAVELIGDEAVLKDIVKNSKNPSLRLVAFKNPNLKDENFLKDVAENEKDFRFRTVACEKISSKSLSNILWKTRNKL